MCPHHMCDCNAFCRVGFEFLSSNKSLKYLPAGNAPRRLLCRISAARSPSRFSDLLARHSCSIGRPARCEEPEDWPSFLNFAVFEEVYPPLFQWRRLPSPHEKGLLVDFRLRATRHWHPILAVLRKFLPKFDMACVCKRVYDSEMNRVAVVHVVPREYQDVALDQDRP